MSEHLRNKHEQHGNLGPELKEVHRQHQEKLQEQAEKKAETSKHVHAEDLSRIRKEAEAAAESAQDTLKSHTSEQSPGDAERPLHVNRELKNMAYQRTLKRTQRQLSSPSKAFSKVIHQPAIEAVSEVASSTIARPSGILAGGIVAFLGSSFFLWIARHYGYEYNFLFFAILFVGGFFLGLLIELTLRVTLKRQR